MFAAMRCFFIIERGLTFHTASSKITKRSLETPLTAVPTSDKPVGFLCLHALQVQPTRPLRREGGEYNTRKGNKPAGC